MPFRSRSQLSTCYGTGGFGRGEELCDRFLKETPSICSLPYRKGEGTSRVQRKGEIVKGKVQTGPRGGKYFMITEKDRNGKRCEIKVYLRR